MPTVLRSGPYRFYFYSNDRKEPPHVHVGRDDQAAKFWLDPAGAQEAGGFSLVEMREIFRIVLEYRQELVEAWHDYFKT